MIMIQNKNF